MDKPRAFDAAKAVARVVARETGLNEVREPDEVMRRRAMNYYRRFLGVMSNGDFDGVGAVAYPESWPSPPGEPIFAVLPYGKMRLERSPAPVIVGAVHYPPRPEDVKTVELSIYDEGDDAKLERLVENDPARRMALRQIAADYFHEEPEEKMPPLLRRLCAIAVAPRKWPRPGRGQGKAISEIRNYRGPIIAEMVSALAELIPELSPTRNDETEPHLSICDAVRDALEEEGINLSYATVAGYYKAQNGPPKDPRAGRGAEIP